MKEQIMHDVYWLMFWCFFTGVFSTSSFFLIKLKKKKKKNIQELCSHDITQIKVLATIGTCETTALFCTECKEQINNPKTDCR